MAKRVTSAVAQVIGLLLYVASMGFTLLPTFSLDAAKIRIFL